MEANITAIQAYLSWYKSWVSLVARKCSATWAGKIFSRRIYYDIITPRLFSAIKNHLTLLIPLIVSTSSCSCFNLAFQRKSVLDVNSICLSKIWNNVTATARTKPDLISNGIAGNLKPNHSFIWINFQIYLLVIESIVIISKEIKITIYNDVSYNWNYH